MQSEDVKYRLKKISDGLSDIFAFKSGGAAHSGAKTLILAAAAGLCACATLFGCIAPFYYPAALYIIFKEKDRTAAAYIGVIFALIIFGGAAALRCLLTLTVFTAVARLAKPRLSATAVCVMAFAAITLSGAALTWLRGDTLLKTLYFACEGIIGAALYPIFVSAAAAAENTRKKNLFTAQDVVTLSTAAAAVLSGLSVIAPWGANLALAASSYIIMAVANCFSSFSAVSYAVVSGLCLCVFASFPFAFAAALCAAAFCAQLFAPIGKSVSVIAFTAVIAAGSFFICPAVLLPNVICALIAAAVFFVTAAKLYRLEDTYRKRAGTLPGLYREAVGSVIRGEIDIQKSMLTEVSRNLRGERENNESSIPRLICRMIAGDVCTGCVQYTRCWKNEADDTLRCFNDEVRAIMAEPGSTAPGERLNAKCSKSFLMFKTLSYIYDSVRLKYSYRQKLMRSRRLLDSQYGHISGVLDKLYDKLSGGIYVNTYDAESALAAMQNEGIPAEKLYIVEDFGHRQKATLRTAAALGQDDLKRLVPQILSESLGKDIAYDYALSGEKNDGEYTYQYTECYPFCLSCGCAVVNRDSEKPSGDTTANRMLSSGFHIFAVCDGMGSGDAAGRQSARVLDLLEELLNAGYAETKAIEMINDILVLDDADEIFAALDLVIFDLNSGLGEFVKAGAAPSFVKRNGNIETIAFESLPVGILESTHIKSRMMKFSKGDFIYIMSDGFFDCFGNDEKYVQMKIAQFDFRNPQKTAEALLADALKEVGEAPDDISVMVIKVRTNFVS